MGVKSWESLVVTSDLDVPGGYPHLGNLQTTSLNDVMMEPVPGEQTKHGTQMLPS